MMVDASSEMSNGRVSLLLWLNAADTTAAVWATFGERKVAIDAGQRMPVSAVGGVIGLQGSSLLRRSIHGDWAGGQFGRISRSQGPSPSCPGHLMGRLLERRY